MKKTLILIATALLTFSNPIFAQSDDKEITVTDAEGKKEIIDLPEGLTQDYDSLLSAYNHKTYLKASTDCNMMDINPVYDKEVYKERLSRIPSVMEMPYNDIVQVFIDRIINCHRPVAPTRETALGLSADSITGRYFSSSGRL